MSAALRLDATIIIIRYLMNATTPRERMLANPDDRPQSMFQQGNKPAITPASSQTS